MPNSGRGESGFTLVGLIVAMFLVMLALGVAAPRVAKALRRDREVESVHRANQYVRAVRLYYRKLGHYPGSLDQLDKTNNIRFLRQHYADPMTGKADWRLIHVGEAKTTVKGFFGKPLTGLPGAGNIGGGIGGSTPGQTPGGGAGAGSGNSSFGSSAFGGGAGNAQVPGTGGNSGSSATSSFGGGAANTAGGAGAGAAAGSGAGSGSGSGIASQSATAFTGGGAPIMGVSSLAGGTSIITVNEQTTYATWEFLYDPRIEQMKAQNGLTSGVPSSGFGGSPIGGGATPFGGAPTAPGGPGAGTPPTAPTVPPQP